MPSMTVFYSRATLSNEKISLWVTRDEGQLREPRDHDRRIGVYRSELPNSALAEFLRAIEVLEAPVDPSPGPLPPGTPLSRIGVFEDEEQKAVHTWRSAEPPAQVAAVVELVRSTITALRASPQRVIEGEAALLTDSIEVDHDLRLRVRLTNVGTEPLVAQHPAAEPGASPILELVVLQAEDGNEVIQAHLPLGPGDVVEPGTPTAAGAGPADARIDPGDSVEVELQKAIHLAPGSYSAQLRYTTVRPDPSEEDRIGGSIELRLGPLTIRRPD